ncbi:MAG: hypothetical protein NTW17_01235 [Candidatus Pacearchaeota archaeon]|nr:hypothetical protein [Candidatus Pacearchaeota archaeon]
MVTTNGVWACAATGNTSSGGDVILNDHIIKLRASDDPTHFIGFTNSRYNLSGVDFWDYAGLLVLSNYWVGPVMTLTQNGNVGIGTTTPTQKLDVNGSANASSFCLGSSCVSDWGTGSNILLASANAIGDWPWTRVVSFEWVNHGGPLSGHDSVQLSLTKRVLGIRITGEVNDGGACVANIKGYFTAISTYGDYNIKSLSLNPTNNSFTILYQTYDPINPASPASVVGFGSNFECAGSLQPSEYIFDSVKSGVIWASPNTGMTSIDAGHRGASCGGYATTAYNKAAGLTDIPAGEKLDYYYYASNGPDYESIKCYIDVLYGNVIPVVNVTAASACSISGGTWNVANSVCTFTQSVCPAGWAFNGWSSTTANTCFGVETSIPGGAMCEGATSCTTGSHAWSNTAIETCGFDSESTQYSALPDVCGYDPYDQSCVQYIECSTNGNTCSANTALIGCVFSA